MPSISGVLRDKIKKQQLENVVSYMQEQVSLYVTPSGRIADTLQAPQDLFILFQQFLANSQENNLLMTGASGAGKTFFGLTYIQKLWENDVDGQPLPLWIPLLSIDNPSHHLLHKHFQYNLHLSADEIQAIFASRIPLIIILDGYDELNTNVNLHQTNQFDALPAGTKIITTCRYEALKLVSEDYRHCFISKVADPLSTIEILPFDSRLEEDAPIGCYIKKFLENPPKDIELPQPRWTVTTYLDHLKRLPEIHDLISNPYILGRVIEELPGIVKESEKESGDTKRTLFTRYRLYEIFTERWFKRQADKYRRAGHPASQLDGKYIDKNGKACTLEELFANYTRRLAKAMFHRHINTIEYHPSQSKTKVFGSLASVPSSTSDWTEKYLGDELNSDLPLLRAGCPLLRLGPRRYTFLHKSLAEFFSAQHLFNGALVQAQVLSGRNLNYGNLQLEPQILAHLVDQAKTNPAFEQVLWGIIELSKSEPTVWRAAANAATIIARAKNFIGANLRRARLGGEEGNEKWGADLSHTWMDDADAREADLRHCTLEGTSIVGLKLQQACLDGIKFGELPYLEGHNFCYSPDGKFLALAKTDSGVFGYSCKIIFYLCSSYEIDRSFSATGDYVEAMSFSLDNEFLILCGNDRRITVRSTVHNSLLHVFFLEQGYQIECLTLMMSSDLMAVLLGSTFKRQIKIWDIRKGVEHDSKINLTVALKKSNVAWIAYSPNGQEIVLSHCSSKGFLEFINSVGQKTRFLSSSDFSSITRGIFSPNGALLASFGYDFEGEKNCILLWDISAGRVEKILDEHPRDSLSARFVFKPDSSQLATTGGDSRSLFLWKIPSGEFQRKIIGHTDSISQLAYHPSGLQLAAGCENNIIHLWQLTQTNNEVSNSRNGDTSHVSSLACSSDGKLIAIGYNNGEIIILEIVSNQIKYKRKMKHHDDVTFHVASVIRISFSLDNNLLASQDEKEEMIISNVLTGDVLKKYMHRGHLLGYVSTQFSANSLLLLGKQGKKSDSCDILIFCDLISQPDKPIYSKSITSYSDDNLRSVSTLHNHATITILLRSEHNRSVYELQVWDKDIRTATILKGDYPDPVISVNPEDFKVAVSSYKEIHIYEIKNGLLKQKIVTGNNNIKCMAYSPDGLLLASSGDGGNIQIWHALTYECLATIHEFMPVTRLAWMRLLAGEELASYSLASSCKEGIKIWSLMMVKKKIDYHLAWVNYQSIYLTARNIDLSRATGLSKSNYALLKQRSQSTLQGEPTDTLSSVVLASRNKQKYIAGGKLEVKKPNGTYTLNHDRWLISLVRKYAMINDKKKLTDHVYLIIQGIDENCYTVIKEIDLVLKNKQLHFFEMVGSAKIRIHEKSPWDLKEKENFLESISREVERAQAELLIGKVHARIASEVGTGYLITGKAPRLFNIPWQNCLSFCLEMLQEAHIPIEPQEKDWASFFCAFPDDYIPDPTLVRKVGWFNQFYTYIKQIGPSI